MFNRKHCLSAIIVGLCIIASTFAQGNPFVMQVKTDNSGISGSSEFTIPLKPGLNYDFTVSFDGQTMPYASDRDLTLTFPGGPGTYDVIISGTFPAIYFNGGGDRLKLVEIKQWGSGAWLEMEAAFEGCSNLKVTAPDTPNFSAVTNMDDMFLRCTSLDRMNVTNWDVSNVTSMEQMFRGCTRLVNYTGLTTWNVSKVTSFHRMFFYNRSLVALDLTGWNTSSGRDMAFMFYRCDKMTEFKGYEQFDVSKVETFRAIFNDLKLDTLDVSQWNTASMRTMDSMFSTRYAMTVTGLEQFDVRVLRDAARLFGNRPDPLTTEQYDAILIAWAAQITVPSEYPVVFAPGEVSYSRAGAAAAARQHLIDNNWVILDGGPVNNVPVADSQTVTFNGGTAYTITLSGSDADGDALTFRVIDHPGQGALVQAGTVLTYTPFSEFGAVDELTFVASDGVADSAPATVRIAFNTAEWDGGGADNNFSTAANWVGDVLPNEKSLIVLSTLSSTPCELVADTLVGGIDIQEGYSSNLLCRGFTLTVAGPTCNLGTATTFNAGTGTLALAGTMPQSLVINANETFSTLNFGSSEVTVSNRFRAGTIKAAAGADITFLAGQEITVDSIELVGTLGTPVVLRSSLPGTAWKLRLTKAANQVVSHVFAADSNAGRGAQIDARNGGIDLGNCINWLFGDGIALTSDADSYVSPAWVEGMNGSSTGTVSVSVNGGPAFPATRMGNAHFFVDTASTGGKALGIELAQGTATTVNVSTGSAAVSQTLNWISADITQLNALHIRRGSSLLLTATGAGTTMTIDADGDGAADFEGAPGSVTPFFYHTAGIYTAAASIDGAVVGTLSVIVVDHIGVARLGNVFGKRRTKDLVIQPSGQAVSAWAPAGSTIRLTSAPASVGITVSTQPTVTGTDALYLRLGGSSGPVMKVLDVDTFALNFITKAYFPHLKQYSDGTQLIGVGLEMSPFFKEYAVELTVQTSGTIFEETGGIYYWPGPDDFDKNGQLNFYLFGNAKSNNCHNTGAVREEGE